MYLVNTESIPGYRVRQSLGLVQGNTIRAKHIGRDIMAGFKNIVGGEIVGYTELLAEARNEATQRMIAQAQSMGANAIVNVRYSTASVMQAAAEVHRLSGGQFDVTLGPLIELWGFGARTPETFAYGTAVIVEPENVG